MPAFADLAVDGSLVLVPGGCSFGGRLRCSLCGFTCGGLLADARLSRFLLGLGLGLGRSFGRRLGCGLCGLTCGGLLADARLARLLLRLSRGLGCGFGGCLGGSLKGFALAINEDLDLGNQIDRQPHAGLVLAKVANGLHVDLLALDLVARLLLDDRGHILRGDRTIELASLAGLDREGQRETVDLLGESLQFTVLGGAFDLRLSADLLRGLECAGSGEHRQFLCEQEIAAVAVRDLFHVAGAAKFVDVFN